MKYTIAVATFVGLISAAEPVWSLRSVNDHRTDSTLQQQYGTFSTTAANGRPPYQSTVQVEDSSSDESSSDSEDLVDLGDDDVDHSGEFFKHSESDMLGDGGYKRVTPARFAADSDDIFMRSMVEQYALEGKNKDGSPNGQFWMNEAGAKQAVIEVLGTHKGMTGEALTKYVSTYFPRTWAHFDVNRGGKIEVIKMPQLMRFISSDQQMYLW